MSFKNESSTVFPPALAVASPFTQEQVDQFVAYAARDDVVMMQALHKTCGDALLDALDSSQETALYAATNGSLSSNCLDYLLNAGADINKPSGSDGVTPLMNICFEKRAENIVNSFLEMGADIHARDKDGWTALHWACWNNNLEKAHDLLKAGAEINAVNLLGDTPLILASAVGMRVDLIALLLQEGANPCLRCGNGLTAADYFNNNSQPEMRERLQQAERVWKEKDIALIHQGIMLPITRKGVPLSLTPPKLNVRRP